jgi:hypothetical protein
VACEAAIGFEQYPTVQGIVAALFASSHWLATRIIPDKAKNLLVYAPRAELFAEAIAGRG